MFGLLQVVCRYRGKGTQFFPGKIRDVRKNHTGVVVFDIDYDDGDDEAGALSANVRRKPDSASSGGAVRVADAAARILSGGDSLAVSDYEDGHGGGHAAVGRGTPHARSGGAVDCSGHPLSVGDAVEALYKGKGTKFYAGKISSIKESFGSYTFNVAYNDGDKEEGALPANVRKVGVSGTPKVTPAPFALAESALLANRRNPTTGGLSASGMASPHAAHDADGNTLVVGDKVRELVGRSLHS
jgi:hypothetical protein